MDESSPSRGSVDTILEHFGKKGMRWGKRKKEVLDAPDDLNPVTLYSKSGKGITRSAGGQGRLPSNDAKDAAISKQIARKSGVDALSNDQLAKLNKRINLEQSYAKIAGSSTTKSAGRRFVEGIVSRERDALLTGKKGPLTTAIGSAFSPGKDKAGESTASPASTAFKKAQAMRARQKLLKTI